MPDVETIALDPPEMHPVGQPVAAPEKAKAKPTEYVVLQAGSIDGIAYWVEVARTSAHGRDAALKGVGHGMIETAMRDGKTLAEAFDALNGTTFVAVPASSFVPAPLAPRVTLGIG